MSKFNFPQPWVKDPETQQNNDALKLYLDSIRSGLGLLLGASTDGTTAITVPTVSSRLLPLGAEVWDTNAVYNPLSTVLGGTVTKTIGTNTLVGVGTTFTSLAVGDPILVGPVTDEDVNVVTAITDDTNLTVKTNWLISGAGVAIRRSDEAFVIKTAGVYAMWARIDFGPTALNSWLFQILKNGLQTGRNTGSLAYTEAGIQSSANWALVVNAAVNDYFCVEARHNTGVNQTVNGRLTAVRLGSIT